jgi:NADH-quinone oxidoreductase subunit L
LVLLSIFIYIGGYLRNEKESIKYIIFVTIFVLGMLVMIYFESILIILIGWEVIGISSYLLIG